MATNNSINKGSIVTASGTAVPAGQAVTTIANGNIHCFGS